MRSGTVKWYRSSYGTDFDISEIAGTVSPNPKLPVKPSEGSF